jgi:transcriptional regulator of met regulon
MLDKLTSTNLYKSSTKQGCQIFLHTKTGKNIPNDHKIYYKAKNIPNVCEKYQIAIKYIILFH